MDFHEAQELIDKEIAAHKSAIRDLRTLRNTHAGISKLPIEVLSDIFLLAKLPYGNIYRETRENRGWLNVAGVCRKWREIALNAPRMWDTLDTSKLNTLDWAATVIARSKGIPLYVSCTYPDRETPRAVLDFVLSHMDRIQDLEVYLNTSIRTKIQEIIDVPNTLCALQSLTMIRSDSIDNGDNGGIDRFLAEVQLPHLQTLDVRFFVLPPTTSMFPQLRHLHYVSPMYSNPSTTVSQMLLFLRNTPSLERLEIEGSFETSDDGGEECTTVELPKLSVLSYSTVRSEHACLFRFLHYPPSSRVKFVSRTHPTDPAACATELASVFTRVASSDMAASMEAVSLAGMYRNYFEMRVSDRDGPMLEVFLPLRGDVLPLFRLSIMLPCSAAHTLHITGFSSVQVAYWASFFNRHERIRNLTAAGVDSNFFRALLKPSENEPPPFTCLGHLLLRHCDINENAAVIERILEEHSTLEGDVDVTLEIWDCRVAVGIISQLKSYAKVEWDGGESFESDPFGEDEDEDEDDEDDEDDSDEDGWMSD
ncbi:hypothetical protein PLEOSDRAFT_1101198 [Pleurotus ostreatus PC15]|uniref:F-box domain-containing protein n=2 Tax=Pleurotus TaxID=5320 RepID=A0A067NQ46_PLEO1|nr:hypothetical protein CCMSSC00406_0006970 [Pleurotus cornucopiae]KDQ30193.1 hypothetical protein PLEOSDRAFT_1101198 [Pleurotus ostreatus PC15]